MTTQRPVLQCGQRLMSMAATRCMKACASSRAWALAAGICSSRRASARRLVLTAGASKPKWRMRLKPEGSTCSSSGGDGGSGGGSDQSGACDARGGQDQSDGAGAGGAEQCIWVKPTRGERFLFPVHALSKVLRGKVLDALASDAVRLPDDPADTAQRRTDRAQALRRHDWVVYAKTPLAGPAAVLDCLSRYTYRTAIGNGRLVAIRGDQVM